MYMHMYSYSTFHGSDPDLAVWTEGVDLDLAHGDFAHGVGQASRLLDHRLLHLT